MDNPEGKVTYLSLSTQTAGLPTSSNTPEWCILRFYPVIIYSASLHNISEFFIHPLFTHSGNLLPAFVTPILRHSGKSVKPGSEQCPWSDC